MGGERGSVGLAVGLLGPVEIGPAGEVLAPVAQPRLRLLLALLGVAAGRVVGAEALVEGVWGEEWSPGREKNLHTLIYQLRRRLAQVEPGKGGRRLVRAGAGYRLALRAGELDVEVFSGLAGRGRAAARAGDPVAARELFGQALELWRGAALADAAPLCPVLAGEAARLEETRLAVVEERIGCDLALGRHSEVVGELAGLVAQFPLRERLAGLLMTALYRCGRRGEALAAYDAARRVLAEELGLDPGPELAGLQAQVLADDPALAAPTAVSTAPAAAATRALPRDIASFTGRQAELTWLLGMIDGLAAAGGVVGIHAIDGMAGVGKTTLAVHAAHRLAAGFPDGQFFLPLHAHTPGQRPVGPADALASLLLTAGVAAAQVPPGVEARAGRWRDHTAGKKILLVLDDAASHGQVRPLLPGTAGSLVLVTSRRRLTALEDAAAISLDVLPAGEAAGLLARLAGRPDLASGTGPADEITRLCGYLPLAIGMLASQLRHHPAWTAAGLAAELAAARDRLALMHAENLSVAAAFGLSYDDLTQAQQRLFRRLGLVPGPSVDAHAAAALDGTSLDEARRCLDELYDQHLIGEPAPGRYQLHDLLREHARTLAADDDPAESDAAAGRLLDYYLQTALAAGQQIPNFYATARRPAPGGPPGDAPDLSTPRLAAAWLEAERPNLHAAVDYAAATGRPLHAVQIPAAMGGFLAAHGHWDQAAALHQTALTAARRAGDRAGQAGALLELGMLAGRGVGDCAAAADLLAQAVTLYADLGDRLGQAATLNLLGWVQVLTGDYPAAVASHRQALALARGSGDRLGEADALGFLGFAQQMTGDYQASAADLADALALYRSLGHRIGEGDALNDLGTLQMLTGDYPAAAANIRQALEIFRDLDDRPYQAWALKDLGELQTLTGDHPAAAANIRQALEIFRELGSRLGEAEALNRLGELSLRTSATGQARDQHTRALATARDLGVPFEEARALEGLGNSHLHDGNPGQADAYLRQALSIYQRIGAPRAQRVQETLHHHGLAASAAEPQPAPPSSENAQPRPRAAPSTG
jgi:DNA-binding SARP family transcriptional activator/Tfp pilus assembly protein PilF